MRKTLVAMCALALLFGCAKKPPVQEEIVVDPADRALAKAAAEIQRDLRMLSESGYDGPLPAETQSLAGMANYRFTGEIEDIVRDVGRNIGYNVDFSGRTPPEAIIVAIHSDGPMSWFNILQSAGVQAGDRANITVNDATKTITLSYDGIDMNAPRRQRRHLPARDQVERNNANVLPSKKADRQAMAQASRVVSAQSERASDAGPRTVRAAALTVGQPEYAQGSPGVYQGPNAGVQEPISQPAAQPAMPGNGFRYSGSILGAQKELAGQLGYSVRTEGTPRDIAVAVDAGDWRDAANSINQQVRDASIFVDAQNKLVVLRFWR